MLNSGNQHLSGDRAPDLRLSGEGIKVSHNRVLAFTNETLNAKILFDTPEEQLDLPIAIVMSADVQCGQAVFLVRHTNALPDSVSLKRMRHTGTENQKHRVDELTITCATPSQTPARLDE